MSTLLHTLLENLETLRSEYISVVYFFRNHPYMKPQRKDDRFVRASIVSRFIVSARCLGLGMLVPPWSEGEVEHSAGMGGNIRVDDTKTVTSRGSDIRHAFKTLIDRGNNASCLFACTVKKKRVLPVHVSKCI